MENTDNTKVIGINVIPVLIVTAMHNSEHADYLTCKCCGKRGTVLTPITETEIVRDGICLNCLNSQQNKAA